MKKELDYKKNLDAAGDTYRVYAETLKHLCYGLSKQAGWHNDIHTGEPIVHNKGERLMLIVTEVAEAMEGARKNIMDDHLPNRKMEEVELADACIRIFDYCGAFGLDIGGAIVEKLQYNTQRLDHKRESRLGENGKKC